MGFVVFLHVSGDSDNDSDGMATTYGVDLLVSTALTAIVGHVSRDLQLSQPQHQPAPSKFHERFMFEQARNRAASSVSYQPRTISAALSSSRWSSAPIWGQFQRVAHVWPQCT